MKELSHDCHEYHMEKILIVEDDRFSRETFSYLLCREVYDVDCVTSGGEALKILSEHRYGLVITDMLLPDISGLELLSHVRETDPTIDVIMVTGNADIESAIFALKHGARDYLIKPVNPDEFCHSVKLCMEQRRLLGENEELKNMVNLYQSSQSIAGCLELERIYHLLVDAVAREIGVSRGIGLFLTAGQLELREIKGLTLNAATGYRDLLLPDVPKYPSHDHLMITLQLKELDTALLGENDTGIKEAYLIFMRGKNTLQGLMAMFNDPGMPLPDFQTKKKNILFLLEQSVRAFDNAETYLQAKDMLFIDDLSGLFNYRYLEIALDRELKRAERYASHLAVLFLDIDSFKRVNDTHGHLVGSRVLGEIGALLIKLVREVDVVIRYGGDEYTIILVETGCDSAGMIAERIRKQVESHIFMASEGYNIRLTCSIGYSCCPEDAVSKQELLDMADKAMYTGKASGKNSVKRFKKTDS